MELLTTSEAARYVRLGQSTLEKLRCSGGGPRYLKLGARRVGYRRDDLDAWLEGRPHLAHTSEAA